MKKAKPKNPKRGTKKIAAKAKFSAKKKAPKWKTARTVRRKLARQRRVVLGSRARKPCS